MHAGSVLKEYLQDFANSESGSDWLAPQKGPPAAKKKSIQAWWEEASAMGEKAYVAKHVLGPNPNVKKKDEVVIGKKLLLIQKTRYPEQLPDTYRRLLKSKTNSHAVAKAISESAALPLETKIALLKEGIASGKPEHRNDALWAYRELDEAAAEAVVLQLLSESPATAEGSYWNDQNAELARFVSASRDPKIWEAFHNLLSRADLGMKMELIGDCAPKRDAPPEVLASFYKVYDRFAEDETMRDRSSSEKFSGHAAASSHDRITLREFVHTEFAQWLEFPRQEPDGENKEEWVAYCAKVREALEAQRKAKPAEEK